MKRIALLLTVLVALAWIGSKLVTHTEPNAAAVRITAEASRTQAEALKRQVPTPERPSSAAQKKAQQERWFGAQTIVAAEHAVRNGLKDPGSAKFKDVFANYTEKFGVVACGRVNAKNEFGGYTGFRRFVSAGQSVILEGRDKIADAWSGACL